jgi:pimeloyl-ACP methyl ester carboxylesterase
MDLNEHRWGDTGGRRVLLLHGLQSSGATWWRIASALAEQGAEVTAPDLRGHGASPRGDGYAFRDFVGDLRPGWDLVVGHSLGGALAAQALADDPDFAKRVVLLDPVFEIPDGEFEAVLADQLAERTLGAQELQAANPRWHPDDIRLKLEAAAACAPATVEAVLRDNRPWDHAHLLATRLEILGGDPAHGALFTRSDHPGYRLLAGTGHSPHRDDPRAVLEALDAGL